MKLGFVLQISTGNLLIKKHSQSLHKIARELKPDVLCSLGDNVDYDGIGKFTLKNYGDGVDECEEAQFV